MSLIKKNVAFVFAVALCAFAFAEKMPAWVNTPAKVFPAEKYFAQVGEGASQKKADLAAVENLAAIFGRDVKSSLITSKRMAQAQKSGQVETGSVSEFSQDITQKVSQENLFGIELKESFLDGKTYYALAVMDKEKTAVALVSMITKNEEAIKQNLNYYDGEVSLEAYGALHFAREVAILNEKYLQKLNVIKSNSAATLRNQCTTAKTVSQQLTKLAQQIPIYIRIEGDSEGKLQKAFADMLKAIGFRTSDDSNERYVLSGSLSFDKRVPRDGSTIQYYYTFEGNLSDSELYQNLWPFSFTGRESSVDETDLSFRMYRTLESKIKTTINASFLNFLNSL